MVLCNQKWYIINFCEFTRVLTIRLKNFQFLYKNKFVVRILKFKIPELPRFIIEPKDVTVLAGQNVRFDCEVDSIENVRLTWKKEQQEVMPGASHVLFNHRTSLNITKVTEHDEGLYTCIAQNIAGEISSKASLTVHSK